MVVHIDTSQTNAYEDNAEEGLFERYDVFEDRMLLRGKPITETEQAFMDMVENPNVEDWYVRKQWLVPKFEGVRRKAGLSLEQLSSTARSAIIENPDSVRNLQASGQKLISSFSQASLNAAPVGMDGIGTNTPECSVTMAEQQQRADVPYVMGIAIQGEVRGNKVRQLNTTHLHNNNNAHSRHSRHSHGTFTAHSRRTCVLCALCAVNVP